MNRSRQEFSSRGKSFNSNGGGGGGGAAKGWKQVKASGGNKSKKGSGTVGGVPEVGFGKNRTKGGEKLQNGFEEEKKGKKVPHVVNGNHKAGGFAGGKKEKSGVKPVGKVEKVGPKSPKVANGDVKKELKVTPDTGQKRKNLDNSVGSSKKLKKSKKEVPAESDSDAEDYMDKFFEDCLDDGSVGPSEPSEQSESELTESDSGEESDDEDDGNAMSFEELMDFYGKNKDQNGSGKKTKTKKAEKVAARKASNSSTVTNGGWLEEDNDVELEYKDSDGEQPEQVKVEATCQALVPAAEADELATSEDDYDYSPGDSGEEELEDEEDSDDFLSFELGSDYDDDSAEEEGEEEEEDEDDSYGSDYSDVSSGEGDRPKDDHEFSSDFDSDEEDSFDDEEEDDYWEDTGSYDSGDDDDYVPMDGEDDLYISRGEAVIYEIDDNSVSFDDGIESAQIVELPSGSEEGGGGGGGRRGSVTTTGTTTTGTDGSQTEGEEEEQVPELVPIYDGRGRMIDSEEKLQRELRKSKVK